MPSVCPPWSLRAAEWQTWMSLPRPLGPSPTPLPGSDLFPWSSRSAAGAVVSVKLNGELSPVLLPC